MKTKTSSFKICCLIGIVFFSCKDEKKTAFENDTTYASLPEKPPKDTVIGTSGLQIQLWDDWVIDENIDSAYSEWIVHPIDTLNDKSSLKINISLNPDTTSPGPSFTKTEGNDSLLGQDVHWTNYDSGDFELSRTYLSWRDKKLMIQEITNGVREQFNMTVLAATLRKK